MNDVTSFETTKKLLEAGFPKSDDWGLHYWIIDEPETKRTFQHSIGGSYMGNGDGNSRSIRASSALDILKVLGMGYYMCFDDIQGKWICVDRIYNLNATSHRNPAEAVAEMFLKINITTRFKKNNLPSWEEIN